jgi:hypothetical protein
MLALWQTQKYKATSGSSCRAGVRAKTRGKESADLAVSGGNMGNTGAHGNEKSEL